jgi:transposase-like protein
MSDVKTFSAAEKAKLVHLINEGISVLSEVEILNGGLNDTIKAIAEELEIKPSVLKRAVKTAFKSSFHQTTSDFEQLETILETVGRTE